MKKPKDVQDLATRLMSAATTPLAVPPMTLETPAAVEAAPADSAEKPVSTSPKARKAVNRRTVSVFLRMHSPLFEEYDREAVRRTKATGRGVTVQQVILERLEKAAATT